MADAKLQHLVRKIAVDDPIEVVNLLRKDYREYRRKDTQQLTAQVEQVLQQQSLQRKRKAQDEEADEKQAQELDAMREGTGGGLNATLRNRYKQVSMERANSAVSENEETNNTESAATEAGETPSKPEKVKRRKVKSRRLSLEASSGGMGGSLEEPGFLSPVARPVERYSDLGGMTAVVQQIRQLVEYPLVRPELYRHLGVDPPRGVLLRGPPGTGKTHLANAVAGQLGVAFFRVSSPELVSGMSGESESRIRSLFQKCSDAAPAILFLDELDAIAPKRSEGGRGMEQRMVAQLLTCMDLLKPENNQGQAAVIVLAATNRPDAMDPALRRAGRFDKEILLGVPDEDARKRILETMTKDMRLSGDFDFRDLARKTPGFVGADVKSLAKEAAVIAINRIFQNVLKEQTNSVPAIPEDSAVSDALDVAVSSQDMAGPVQPLSPEQMEPLYVSMDDFLEAIPLVQPSSKREGFATVPDVSWDEIGALQSIREELTMSVLEPIRSPEKFKALGLSLPAGVLLYGPPGCGKTLLAKAIANESGANFISVKGPELLDKYVGESERAVRVVFERARASSPCVVFFDELDSLVPKRGSGGDGGGGVSERVVNQLLTEMDGLESRRSVFVIAATNRPELIDPAMMRPGRLDKLLYVPLPSPEDRASILTALAGNIQIDYETVDLAAIGKSGRAEGYSGADCAALLREAGLAVLKEDAAAHTRGDEPIKLQIGRRHFDEAFRSVLPSVSKKDQARYDRLRNRMARARCRTEEEKVKVEETPPLAAPAST